MTFSKHAACGMFVLLSVFTGLVFFFLNAIIPQERQAAVDNVQVSEENLRKHVRKLTEIYPARWYQNPELLDRSAEYILAKFKEFNGKASVQTFSVDGQEYSNVIASYGPQDAERIIVGAHYDVCSIQPGADDNASGVAGLLEIARLLGERKPALNHRVDLVAYSLEEPPFFGSTDMGSAFHAKSLSDKQVKVRAMISLEMIGYFSDAGDSQDFPLFILKPFYPHTGNFIAVVGNLKSHWLTRRMKKLISRGSDIEVHTLSAPFFIREAAFSDHLSYWHYGYKAVMVTDTAFFRNPNYHKESDTIDTLDFGKMAEVVRGVYWAVVNL